MTGPAEKMIEVFAYLEGKIVLNVSPIMGERTGHVRIIRVVIHARMVSKSERHRAQR